MWYWPMGETLSPNHSIEMGIINSGSNQFDINIQGVKEGPGHGESCYWIDDGAHGSKNCLPVIHPFIQTKFIVCLPGTVLSTRDINALIEFSVWQVRLMLTN